MSAPLLLWNEELDRQLVDLIYTRGFSRREAAKVLRTTKGSVINRIRRLDGTREYTKPIKQTAQTALRDSAPQPFKRISEKAPNKFVRLLFIRMNAEWISQQEMAERSGVSKSTINRWHTKAPNIDFLEACLNVVDIRLTTEDIE